MPDNTATPTTTTSSSAPRATPGSRSAPGGVGSTRAGTLPAAAAARATAKAEGAQPDSRVELRIPLSRDEFDELNALAESVAHEAELFLTTVRDVASGQSPDSAISLLLLATAEILTTGSRLGAIGDIVPIDRFEIDPGPESDPDPIRDALANVFEGLDEYADVVDPLTAAELTKGSLANDFADIVLALTHGLAHQQAGRSVEALWWWQFSYLSTWGDRAASALRVLQSILAHLRLDADDDEVAEAEFDALHP